jgi:hypothetical protein
LLNVFVQLANKRGFKKRKKKMSYAALTWRAWRGEGRRTWVWKHLATVGKSMLINTSKSIFLLEYFRDNLTFCCENVMNNDSFKCLEIGWPNYLNYIFKSSNKPWWKKFLHFSQGCILRKTVCTKLHVTAGDNICRLKVIKINSFTNKTKFPALHLCNSTPNAKLLPLYTVAFQLQETSLQQWL